MTLNINSSVWINPESVFETGDDAFDWNYYSETEQELWAFFPETTGKRVNMIQVGLSAFVFAEMPDDHQPLQLDETYILMPCEDQKLRPIRMKIARRLTLQQYRRAHLTCLKMIGHVCGLTEIYAQIGHEILGEEVMEEAQARWKGVSDDDN